MKSLKLRTMLLAALVGASFFVTPQAFAHKVNVFAYAEGKQVYVEGYFVDGKKAQNSTVQVLNPAGQVLQEGMTNDEGQYRFSVAAAEDLRIVLKAGMGHQGEYLLPANELSVALPAAPAQATATATQIVSEPALATQAPADTSVEAEAPAASELEAVVYKAVNEAIRPLVRELEASQQKASLTGILGGIGYIFGILGLFAYLKARQNERNKG